MDPVPRLFSLQEANTLVPALAAAFERVARLRQEISEHLDVLTEAGVVLDPGRPLSALPVPPQHRAEFQRLLGMLEQVARTVEGVTEHGCVVKDLELGLVDFYSVVDGKPAWLCWQYGEQEISWYHGLEEGLAGRQRLPGGRRGGTLYN